MSRDDGTGFPGTEGGETEGVADDLSFSFSMSLSRKYADSEDFTTSPFKNESLSPRLPTPD